MRVPPTSEPRAMIVEILGPLVDVWPLIIQLLNQSINRAHKRRPYSLGNWKSQPDTSEVGNLKLVLLVPVIRLIVPIGSAIDGSHHAGSYPLRSHLPDLGIAGLRFDPSAKCRDAYVGVHQTSG